MAEAQAWVLSFDKRLRAAVGELELVHVLPEAPTLIEIPDTPSYCRHVILWQQRVIPVMNLAARLLGERQTESHAVVASIDTLVGILAYQSAPGEPPGHGALLLSRVPTRARVSDSQACGLPAKPEQWASLAISCFEHRDHGPIPVLDVPRLFLSPPASRAARYATA